MKFGKELDRTLTPEWRPKYLNYRVGKKHVKGIARSTIQVRNYTARLNSPSDSLPEVYSQTTRLSGSQSSVSEDDDSSSFGGSEYGDTVPLTNTKANPRLAFPGRPTLATLLPRTEDQEWKMAKEAINQLEQRTKEYHTWLGEELEKVEAFYKLKEDEARNRLGMLRYQLQEMQQQRPETTAKSTPNPKKSPAEVARQDYIRKSSHGMPYRSAKGQLRHVFEEFYGALDMLKSYALLNQKAFRKINKKYKKVTDPNLGATKPNNIRVDQSYFVQSTLLEDFLTSTRDLYAEHFEKGNKKRATRKLRATIEGFGDETGRSFFNGLLLGTAGIFLAHGISSAIQFLDDPNPLVRYHTKVLLQIYGGYFLMLYLFCMFCHNCAIWQSYKINYTFIFEFDRRNNLSVSELAKYANTFLLLLGITIYANFRIEIEAFSIFFLYWPVFLIGLTLLIIFFPAPIMGPQSRKWFLISHYRLFTAGLNTVEFRDVFLGDMYTSLGFSLGNIGFFFCMYSVQFDGAQCDIKHIFAASLVAGLPAVWRLLQCLRRYNDSMAAFPHLVNGGKYIFSLLFTITISFYRFDGSFINLILVIIAAVINAVYSSLWDIFMDFSLFAPNTSILKPTLRPTRVFKSKSIYIAIAIFDVMLRFTWVLLVLFAHSEKFQVLVSFLVGFGEVTRRSMWMLLRVENEHCGNLGGLKAYRQLELPYQLITREELALFGQHEKSAAGVDGMV